MRIRKYDFDYSRRQFLEKTSKGIVSAGILTSLWPVIARTGEITKAYPDELLSIDAYTKGAIKTGDMITADNVDLVKELVNPIIYRQIKEMGRQIKIVPTTTELSRLMPWEYMEATLSNQGKAQLNDKGNVVAQDGQPWIGGNPFPDPQNGLEAFANNTLSWGRHDASFYVVEETDLNPDGTAAYEYEFCWAEMQAVGRTTMAPKPYWPGHEDKLRYQSIFYISPNDAKGSSFLNIWPYDQTEFPELYGYLPAFKRVRRFPTNQRFEPIIAGSTFFLSDAWSSGDPFLTWGNYKIVHRGPFLGCVNAWNPDKPNWRPDVHGGGKGKTFYHTEMELVPDVIVVEAEPVKYPRSPVSKKRVHLDARSMMFLSYVTYDRRGELWKTFEPGYGLYEKNGKVVKDGNHPYWSWVHVMSHDIQTNRMTRFHQAENISGGYTWSVNDPDIYDRYLTIQAIRRLGI